MGEVWLFLVDRKVENGQTTILLGAGDSAASARVGGPSITELDRFARVIDPDCRLGLFSQAQVQDGFLITPFAPTIIDG